MKMSNNVSAFVAFQGNHMVTKVQLAGYNKM